MNPDQILERELERLEGRIQTGSGRFSQTLRRSRPTLILLAAGIAFMHLRDLPEQLSNTSMDAAAILQVPEEPRHVSMVLIDDAEYRDLFGGISPLNPARLGELISAVAAGSPALIVVDLDTSHPMFQTMRAPSNVLMVWAVANKDVSGLSLDPDAALGGSPLPPTWLPALDLIPRDRQGLIRSYVHRFAVKNGGYFPSLEFAPSLLLAGRKVPTAPIEPEQNVRLLDFHYKFFPMSAREVLEKSHLPGWPQGRLKGQVVVLGGAYRAARNVYPTPLRLMEGSQIVAQATEAELSATSIPEANPWLAGFLQLVSGFGLVVLYRQFKLRTALLASLVLIPLLSLAASLILFHRIGMWFALIPIMMALTIAELYTHAALYLSLCKKFSELKSPHGSETQIGSGA